MLSSQKVRGADLLQESLVLIDLLGYKEYDTGRKHMARMGDWRDNKDDELQLDGIGGVNIVVKADVHKSGRLFRPLLMILATDASQASTSHAMHSKTKPRPKALPRWQSEPATKSLACRTT
jgi:hypothetical protein